MLVYFFGSIIGYIQAKAAQHYFVIAVFSALFAWITYQSKGALQRIYEHFIEMLGFREELEVRLGLREMDTIGEPILESTKTINEDPLFWKKGRFFKKKWTKSRKIIGYFARMKRMFNVFIFIGLLSILISFLKGCSDTNVKFQNSKIETIEKRLSVIEKRLTIEKPVSKPKQQVRDIKVLYQTLSRIELKIDNLERNQSTIEEIVSHHESVISLNKHLDRHLNIINSKIQNIK